MNFDEYKNAEYWTKKALEKQDFHESADEEKQMSLLTLFIWIFVGAWAIAALWFACFFDSFLML